MFPTLDEALVQSVYLEACNRDLDRSINQLLIMASTTGAGASSSSASTSNVNAAPATDEVHRVSSATGAVVDIPADAVITTGTDTKTGLRTVTVVAEQDDVQQSPRSSEDSFEIVADPNPEAQEQAQAKGSTSSAAAAAAVAEVEVIRTAEEIEAEREAAEIKEAMAKFEEMERKEREHKAKTELSERNFPVLTDKNGWQVAPPSLWKETTAEDLELPEEDDVASEGEGAENDAKETSWKDKAKKAKDLPHPPRPRGDAAYRAAAAGQARIQPRAQDVQASNSPADSDKDNVVTGHSKDTRVSEEQREQRAAAAAEGRTDYEVLKSAASSRVARKFGQTKGNPRGRAYNAFKDERRVLEHGAGVGAGAGSNNLDGDVEGEGDYEAVYEGVDLDNYCTELGDKY